MSKHKGSFLLLLARIQANLRIFAHPPLLYPTHHWGQCFSWSFIWKTLQQRNAHWPRSPVTRRGNYMCMNVCLWEKKVHRKRTTTNPKFLSKLKHLIFFKNQIWWKLPGYIFFFFLKMKYCIKTAWLLLQLQDSRNITCTFLFKSTGIGSDWYVEIILS